MVPALVMAHFRALVSLVMMMMMVIRLVPILNRGRLRGSTMSGRSSSAGRGSHSAVFRLVVLTVGGRSSSAGRGFHADVFRLVF